MQISKNFIATYIEILTISSIFRTLNFNNEPVYIGGVMTVDPIEERPRQVLSDDFVGCIHSASINGRALNLSAPIQVKYIFKMYFL